MFRRKTIKRFILFLLLLERQYLRHMSECVSIRQHTSAYVSIRQHTSTYVSIPSLQVLSVSTPTYLYFCTGKANKLKFTVLFLSPCMLGCVVCSSVVRWVTPFGPSVRRLDPRSQPTNPNLRVNKNWTTYSRKTIRWCS